VDLGNLSPALILTLIVALALGPYVAVMITAFTKLVVVFSLLRNALGLQQTPPNIVLNGLAIILSFYVMYPVALEMQSAVGPGVFEQMSPAPTADNGKPVDPKQAAAAAAAKKQPSLNELLAMADRAKEPLKKFLVKHTSLEEREFFLSTLRKTLPEDKRAAATSEDLIVVVPAFTVSELARAFQIGFIIFLPFLVIDLIVANILQAMGMMMLSPTTISLPFKLLLFVLLDGWSKLIHGLVLTY
jgi:type III secretion protein R